ncbi:MAG: FliH/SctL family protein [Bryobacteraceae bacterium]|nr:FliH/SctL family protein [Bryobacteraceae bacterium]
MSSRVRRGSSADVARPFAWSYVGDGQAAPERPAARPAADAHQQQLAALEAQWARQAELEYQRGRREGEAAGAQRADEKLRSHQERLAASIAETATYRDRYRRQAEQDLVRLALAIARRILQRELHIDPEAILGLVKVALEKIALREVQTVRVHSGDLPILKAHLDRIGAPPSVKLEADPSLERGAVIFDTVRGQLDASVETQLQQIEQGFSDLLRRSA